MNEILAKKRKKYPGCRDNSRDILCFVGKAGRELLLVLALLLQQSADGQGDLLVLHIHVGDLHVHLIALGQHVAGLVDPL